MKISFAICTHNESEYIGKLLDRLTGFISIAGPLQVDFEIVIVDDFSDDVRALRTLEAYKDQITVHKHALNGNYAEQKNFLNNVCTGDWILNLDADEFVADDFIALIPHIIDANPDIEAYWVPRINTVEGLTLKHVQQWGWVLTRMEDQRKIRVLESTSEEYKLLKDFNYIISDDNGVVTYYEPIVSWPDFQMRLYRNKPEIKWVNKVHERLTGFDKFGMIPQDPDLAIRHFKEIKRQEKQNEYYQTL